MTKPSTIRFAIRLLAAALLVGSALSFSGCAGPARLETWSDFSNGGEHTVREW